MYLSKNILWYYLYSALHSSDIWPYFLYGMEYKYFLSNHFVYIFI